MVLGVCCSDQDMLHSDVQGRVSPLVLYHVAFQGCRFIDSRTHCYEDTVKIAGSLMPPK